MWPVLLATLLSAAAPDGTVIASFPDSPFHIPDLVLSGRLGQTLSVSSCEAISGVTCKITLKAGQVLPSRVYFSEVGADGNTSRKKVRLIYPNLKPGESGRATLRSGDNASRLVLKGEWDGPWQNPY